jgi:hypothetical protein
MVSHREVLVRVKDSGDAGWGRDVSTDTIPAGKLTITSPVTFTWHLHTMIIIVIVINATPAHNGYHD